MQGALWSPRGILVHGTQSGQPYNHWQEYQGTVNFVRNGAYDSKGTPLGWHVTIGVDRYCTHMRPTEWGWNAGDDSKRWVACEFVQAQIDDLITDGQIDMFVYWFENEVMPIWPNIPQVFMMHSETAQGQSIGKTDAARRGAGANRLRNRMIERLAA